MITKPLFLQPLFIFFTLTSSSQFSAPLNFALFGNAIANNTSITLTQIHNCISKPRYSNIGRVIHNHPIQLLDSSFNSTVSFRTRFSFTVTPPPPPCLSGEGIAFFITSDIHSMLRSVGSMGLPKSLDQSSPDFSFLAVEFDTYFDEGLGDINDNHVGINLDSMSSAVSLDLASNGIDLKSGKQITAWIEYRNPQKLIMIWVGYTQTQPVRPVLGARIDLSERFNEPIYVGFSADNGVGSATQSIDSWEFSTSTSSMSSIIENCLLRFPENPIREEEERGLSGTRLVYKWFHGFLIHWWYYILTSLRRRNPVFGVNRSADFGVVGMTILIAYHAYKLIW